jgi:hypothetical protein
MAKATNLRGGGINSINTVLEMVKWSRSVTNNSKIGNIERKNKVSRSGKGRNGNRPLEKECSDGIY